MVMELNEMYEAALICLGIRMQTSDPGSAPSPQTISPTSSSIDRFPLLTAHAVRCNGENTSRSPQCRKFSSKFTLPLKAELEMLVFGLCTRTWLRSKEYHCMDHFVIMGFEGEDPSCENINTP